jgi:hypothetical protein
MRTPGTKNSKSWTAELTANCDPLGTKRFRVRTTPGEPIDSSLRILYALPVYTKVRFTDENGPNCRNTLL